MKNKFIISLTALIVIATLFPSSAHAVERIVTRTIVKTSENPTWFFRGSWVLWHVTFAEPKLMSVDVFAEQERYWYEGGRRLVLTSELENRLIDRTLVASWSSGFGPVNPIYDPTTGSGYKSRTWAWGIFKSFEGPVTYTLTYSMAIPEPKLWAMMVFGFGVIGAGLRQNKRMLMQ